jgi:DNA-binding NarL/FixJ family response regulator/HPt (histidine-containing phosphotransfer) domain-containing protein
VNEKPLDTLVGQLASRYDRDGKPLAIADLDQEIVNDLLELGGAELFDELATLSCASITQSTADIDLGLRQDDSGTVARAAHAIAGISAGIGATRLAEVAGTLERLAARGDLRAAGVLGIELAACSMRVRDSLEAHTARAIRVTGHGAIPGLQAVDVPATMTFLIVDDAPATRRFVRAALDTVSSFEVVGEADSGQQAIALASSLQPDLILLDLSLGETDGADILPELIRVAPATRAIILSRNAIEAGQAASVAGAIGYIVKGLKAPDLIDRLAAVIGVPLLLKARGITTDATRAHVDLTRAVIFDADPMTRRTINWVLAESNVHMVSEVSAGDNVEALCSAVQLVQPGLVVLGDVPNASAARLIPRFRALAPDAVFINYATDQPLDDTSLTPWARAVPRGDVERLASCVRDLLSGQK